MDLTRQMRCLASSRLLHSTRCLMRPKLSSRNYSLQLRNRWDTKRDWKRLTRQRHFQNVRLSAQLVSFVMTMKLTCHTFPLCVRVYLVLTARSKCLMIKISMVTASFPASAFSNILNEERKSSKLARMEDQIEVGEAEKTSKESEAKPELGLIVHP